MAALSHPVPERRATFALAWHEFRYHLTRYRRTWRGTFVISVVNPLLFLVAIGIGLGKVADPHPAGLGGVSYLAFFAPGMLAAAAMQNGIVVSSFPVAFSVTRGGSYRVAVTTPLAPSDILLGHALYMAQQVAMSAATFLVVMVAFGAAASPLVVLTVPVAALIGMAFAMPTAAWAITLSNPRTVSTLFKWVVMPLYLFSGTFFPVSHMPFVLRLLAYVTPLWHGVELCRRLSLGTASWAAALTHVAYLLALATIGFVVATRNYRRRLHV